MSDKAWDAVDTYLADKLLGSDPVLEAALAANDAAGLPAIDVSPLQGRLLELLARLAGARRVLEIGTLGGFSAISFARGLPPDGRVVTLEIDPRHAEVARRNIARAGLDAQIDVRVGAALDTLPVLAEEGGPPFDIVFIDADKKSNAAYLGWAVKLARRGTLVIVDNVIRDGKVLDGTGENDEGARRLFDAIAGEPRLEATALQTVGAKGWDGFALALVD